MTIAGMLNKLASFASANNGPTQARQVVGRCELDNPRLQIGEQDDGVLRIDGRVAHRDFSSQSCAREPNLFL
jgi:hypothetical protein